MALRSLKSEWEGLLRIATFLAVGGLILGGLGPVVTEIRDWGHLLTESDTGADFLREGLASVLQALGISYLTYFVGSVCRDGGEPGMAAGVELAGKLAVLELSLPMLRILTDQVREVLEWL